MPPEYRAEFSEFYVVEDVNSCEVGKVIWGNSI